MVQLDVATIWTSKVWTSVALYIILHLTAMHLFPTIYICYKNILVCSAKLKITIAETLLHYYLMLVGI